MKKRVVRSDLWINPVFDERLAQAQDIDFQIFPVRGDRDLALKLLSQAHVYQVSAAKDELPQEWFVSAGLIAQCPQLLCVSSTGAGYDTVDVAACTAAGIAVVNQAGGNADSVAEHTLALMLSVSRRMVESDRRMRREQGFTREDVMGHEIRGKTMGLVGMGHIGTRVARLAHAFGMQVIAVDPFLTAEEIGQRGARSVSMPELLAQSDVVSLHCPRDASTLKMMNAGTFAQMKQGALFINTARGGQKKSDHMKMMAIDFVAPKFGSPYEIAKYLTTHLDALDIGQLIFEGIGAARWVHISRQHPEKLVNRVITISEAGTQVGIQPIASAV